MWGIFSSRAASRECEQPTCEAEHGRQDGADDGVLADHHRAHGTVTRVVVAAAA